jgi:hypothetical protein
MSASSVRGKGPLCLSCETEFTATEAPIDFFITGLHTGKHFIGKQQIIMTGICRHCSTQSDDFLMREGMKQMKKIWPDAIELPDGGGLH